VNSRTVVPTPRSWILQLILTGARAVPHSTFEENVRSREPALVRGRRRSRQRHHPGRFQRQRQRRPLGTPTRARTDQRTGNAVHFTTGVPAVRQTGYARLAGISVAHRYNWRTSVSYRKPDGGRGTDATDSGVDRGAPEARPGRAPPASCGSIRCTKAMGTQAKGCSIASTAVDTVTQWEVVGGASKIGEQYPMPVAGSDAASVSLRNAGNWDRLDSADPNLVDFGYGEIRERGGGVRDMVLDRGKMRRVFVPAAMARRFSMVRSAAEPRP